MKRYPSVHTFLFMAMFFWSCAGSASPPPSSSQNAVLPPVVITIVREGNSVSLEARQGTATRRAGPFAERWFQQRFARLYQILEEQPPREDDQRALVVELSEKLMTPLASLIDSASEVVIIVSNRDLKLPFDILESHGRPLFLDRPVSYRFGVVDDTPFAPRREWKAFVVSDESADPDRACRVLMDHFSRVTYRDHNDIDVDQLRTAPAADVVVMSVHGDIDGDDEDNVGLADDEAATSDDFASLKPRLIYLDSCQLGISRSFIAAFRRMGVRYYLAPITSNEAGQSSTQTMKRFFGHLMKGETPERSLFLTRQELFELYKDNPALQRLWRSFPFRVYRLN